MNIYGQKKQDAVQLLDRAITLAEQAKQQRYVTLLRETSERLKQGTFIVVVCGGFRRGKSSLLNALLEQGQDLFPVDISVTTNLVSVVSYGPVERITALLDGGEPDADGAREISIARDEIRLYVTEQENPRNQRHARLLRIEIPHEQLRQGLILVDTPGVGGLYERHSDATYEFIPNADAILYVSDVFQPLSDEDLTFITERILPHTRHIIFVLTKRDRIKDEGEMIRNNREKLEATLKRPADSITIIPVSSSARRAYLTSHEPEDLEESNFVQLEAALWQFIGAHRGQIQLARALTTLGTAVNEMRLPLRVELDGYEEQDRRKLDELEHSLEDAAQRLQHLEERNAGWLTTLRDGLEDIRLDVSHQFDSGFAQIRRGVDRYLDDPRMRERPTQVLEPLQRDINDLLYMTDRRLKEAAAALRSRLEYSSGLALNPFEGDALSQQSRALELSDIAKTPHPGSSWDKAVIVSQRGGVPPGFSISLLGALGGIIGSFFGQPHVGTFLGLGLGWLIGTRSGAGQAIQQVSNQSRQQIATSLQHALDEYQCELKHSLTLATNNVERLTRDDLLDKIRREKQSREEALKALQQARKRTTSEAHERKISLQGPLQQLDQLQEKVKTLINSIMQESGPDTAQGAIGDA